jgi:FlaA1/EpsC-like NDP-sugar epimerase
MAIIREMRITGKRKGEKLYEELMTEDEATNAYEIEYMLVTLPHSDGGISRE